jgi:hypothetical protein
VNQIILTCAFLFLLWRLCAPGDSVVAEMADMESGVGSRHAFGGTGNSPTMPVLAADETETNSDLKPAAGVAPRLSLPAISPDLEQAAIRMVEEWR